MCAAKCGRMISERALLAQIRLDLADGHTHLLHRVALAHGHAVVGGRVLVADGLEVKGDAERRAREPTGCSYSAIRINIFM